MLASARGVEWKEIEKLEKCRQGQLSNFSLTLFFYAFAPQTGLVPKKYDDGSANLLMRLYDVDPSSLKKEPS